MPRPRRPGAPEPKRRSRKGCWPCKARKVKCGEEKPSCLNCRRQDEQCDYSIRLNWGGRTRRKSSVESPGSQSSSQSRHSFSFTLSPPAFAQTDPVDPLRHLKSTSTIEEIAVQDQTSETLFWEAGFAGEMTIGPSYPTRRLHDIQDSPTVPDQSLNNSNCTTNKHSVEMGLPSRRHTVTAPWPELPTQPTNSLSGEDMSSYTSASSSLDNARFPSPVETSPSIASLPNFNFPSGVVSQPISFVRPAPEIPRHTIHHSPFDHSDGPTRDPSTDMRMSSVATESDIFSPSSSQEAISPRSDDTHMFAARARQDHKRTPDSFLNRMGDMDAPSLDNQPGRFNCTIATSSYSHEHDANRGAEDRTKPSSSEKKWQTYLTSVTDNYGLDCGRPDVDLGRNDDHSAIDVNEALDMIRSHSESHSGSSPGSNRGEPGLNIAERSTYIYYASPVPINIPRYLSPLPVSLVKTPINLMYFHHFLNHTARILVPHDCGDNPFSSVLPSMAIGDPNLLNLMLAYSASHRARYLGHPEPANRIAHWVSNVFPSLRIALEGPHEKVTDSHLATAIMLLSLKIVSPSTFEVPIPWQSHLKLARDLFLARQVHMAYPGNRVGAFLTRWLGYLDIMGALSCRHHEPPLLAYYSLLSTCCADEEWDEFEVECFTGYTPRTGLFLMQLGGLVHQCDNERFDDNGAFLPDWRPSLDIVNKATSLMADWEVLESHVHAHERHYQDSESSEMVSVDRVFRYAGLLHLHRRVLGASPDSNAVKTALGGLVQTVMGIRPGAAVEVGALFPIFTAGCEAQDLEQRIEIKERLEVLEGTGMKQIQNARTLMQRCWDTNLPWIALARGEFLG